jgi:hypothetical protein
MRNKTCGAVVDFFWAFGGMSPGKKGWNINSMGIPGS